MDWLQTIANIAQVIGVIWVLVFGGNAAFKVIEDLWKRRRPIRMPKASTVTNVLLALLLLVALSFRFALPSIIQNPGTIRNSATSTSSHRPTLSPTPPLSPTPIPPAFVHDSFHASSDNTNKVSTNPVSLNVTPGDLLIVAVTQYERTLLGSNPVTDDKGDTFQVAGNLIANPNQQQDYAELYFATNTKGGYTTVTVSFNPPPPEDTSIGGATSLGLYEYRGLGSIDIALVTPSKDASSKILTGSSKLNTTATSEMCFALGIDSGPQHGETDDTTVTSGDGYTLRYPTGNKITGSSNGERFYTEDAFVAPTGCNPNFTIAYPSYWGIIGAAFKP